MICYVLGNKANNEIWIVIIFFSTPSLIIVTRFGWYDNDVESIPCAWWKKHIFLKISFCYFRIWLSYLKNLVEKKKKRMLGLHVVNSKLALDESFKTNCQKAFSHFYTYFIDHMLENFQVTEIMTLISKLVDHVNHSAIYS